MIRLPATTTAPWPLAGGRIVKGSTLRLTEISPVPTANHRGDSILAATRMTTAWATNSATSHTLWRVEAGFILEPAQIRRGQTMPALDTVVSL